jgi:hypothetical protein
MKLLENPEIYSREIPDEGKYFEIEWEFEKTPSEKWVKKFETLIKPRLENPSELFGPYKPKIFYSIFITTILDKEKVLKQKDYFEKELFDKIDE